jgi:hypothetical protein
MADYAKGQSAASSLIGSPMLALRRDTPTVDSDTDGVQQRLQVNSAGSVRVDNEGGKATYSATVLGLVAASSCTDLFSLVGSATKVVKVQEVRISGVATTPIMQDVQLIRRSTANSGGTATNPTAAKHNSDNGAATATVNAYTANPTTGTGAGSIAGAKLMVAKADGTGTAPPVLVFDLRPKNGEQSVRLDGIAETLSVNLNGGSPGSGNLFDVSVTWTEEPTTA